jgi:predicted nucleotidyltransferase
MNIFETLNELSAAKQLPFLVIGGHAVNAHGYSRVTQDLDILVARDQRSEWCASLEGKGFRVVHDGGVFLQMTSPEECRWPLDLMLVNQRTFTAMFESSREIEMSGACCRVPSLDHLIALKLHVLKQDLSHRRYKDLMDVLSLVEIHKLDVRGDSFRALCEKYGSKEIYERIVSFES